MKSFYARALFVIATGAAGGSLGAGNTNILAREDNVTAFSNFAKTLGLSDADITTLGDKHANVTALERACMIAQCSLGTAEVDTTPVNLTIVDENWSETCFEQPSCIILPTNSTGVSNALKIIDFFQVSFAVRSGGHSPNPGWSSIQNGILISMEKLTAITLSSDKTFASVGPGARWGDVYTALDPEKAVVIGGRLPQVGVAGLVLGGGFFHISGEFGLAADNVKNFELVLSNGTVVDANADQNNDLFWALKGGGPNFGIVTRYDLYTVPVYEIWGQIMIYAASQALDVLKAFDEWQLDGASDVKSSIALDISLDSITIGLVYAEPANLPSVFAPFYNLAPLEIAVPNFNTTFSAVNTILGASFPTTQARHDYRGCSSKINTTLTQDVYNFWLPKAQAVHNATGANQTFALQHIGSNLVQQGINKGGNALGLSVEDQQWWTTIVDWESESDDDQVRAVSIETTAQWKKLSEERGLDIPFIYMNDASRDQDPISQYGTDNINKLKQVALKYDPKQVFQKLQND
ncbi:Bifunctional solanapyrone synthase, partial [Lachnellula willkommii]